MWEVRESAILRGPVVTALGERFHQLRERLRDKATRARRSLVMHSVTFAGINAVLFLINATTGGGPWFLIPYAFGATAVIQHAVHAANRRRAADELDAAGYLDEGRLKLVRGIQKARAGLRSYGAFAAALSGALFMVNVVSGGSWPWFLIPSAALGVTVAIHAIASSDRLNSLAEQLARSGVDWQKITYGASAAPASASRPAQPRISGTSR